MTEEEVLGIDGVDQLYEVEPAEFVSARQQLSKQLKASGKRDEAVAVGKLRRPTVVVWALNQVARAHPQDIDVLVEATSNVRQAQAAALEGDPSQLREVSQRRRQIVSKLARAAADLAGPAHQDQAAATIAAASVDPELTPRLRRGQLTSVLEAPAGFGIGALPDGTGPSPRLPERRLDLERFRREVQRAEEDVASAEAKVERAEDALVDAQARVGAAKRELEAALGGRNQARRALAEAELP